MTQRLQTLVVVTMGVLLVRDLFTVSGAGPAAAAVSARLTFRRRS